MNKYTYYTIPCIHNTMNPTATAAQTARPPMLVPRITPDGISFFSYIAPPVGGIRLIHSALHGGIHQLHAKHRQWLLP